MADHDELDYYESEDGFDDGLEPAAPQRPPGLVSRFMQLWHDNPAFKIGVVAVGGLALVGGAFAMMNNGESKLPTTVAPGQTVAGTPGSDVSPEYKKVIEEANKEKAQQAMQAGNSAIPTPVGQVTQVGPKPDEAPVDPLAEWRKAEAAQQQPAAPAGMPQNGAVQAVQNTAQGPDEVGPLAQAMQQQIQSLIGTWGPSQAKVVAFVQPKEQNNGQAQNANTTGQPQTKEVTKQVIVPAGEILYGQLMTEANSDVPGPILAQIVSGQLKGGRVIGKFVVSNDYLVLTFTSVSIGGHSYKIDAIALDPATTLGGMATEVDNRYFSRVVLPAAAAFVSQFGSTISQPATSTTVGANGTVVISQEKQTTKDALYAGAGSAAGTVAQFMQNEASRIQPLVRVAANTPIGVFFVSPVTKDVEGTNP